MLDHLPMELAPLRRAPVDFSEPSPSFEARPPAHGDRVEAHSAILSLLSPEPTMVDDLVRRCHLCPSVTVAVLLELELAGRIETLPGNRVALMPAAFG